MTGMRQIEDDPCKKERQVYSQENALFKGILDL